MHVGRISLCDGTAHNIKSDDDKARILHELERHYGVKVVQRHHDDFCFERHADVLNRVPHLACTRSNGNPYFVYLTRCGFVNQCVLVDKKVQQGYFFPRMILLRLRFRDDLYDNTLFDGEMVKSSQQQQQQPQQEWYLLLGDILVHRKRPLTHTNLVDRINLMHSILADAFVPDDQDLCLLRVKTYFPCDQLRRLVEEFVPALPYTCRGVYFRPFHLRQRAILMNFDNSLVRRDVRINYRSTSNFILSTDEVDRKEGGTMPRPVAVATARHHRHASASPPWRPPPSAASATNDRRIMWVKHTKMPDVYEVHPSAPSSTATKPEIACVPNLASSLMLRRTFEYYGVNDAVPMDCVYNERFKKWAPVGVAATAAAKEGDAQ